MKNPNRLIQMLTIVSLLTTIAYLSKAVTVFGKGGIDEVRQRTEFNVYLPLPPIEAACQFLREPYTEAPKLYHGDLVPWNLLVNTGHLYAVIDWNGAYGGVTMIGCNQKQYFKCAFYGTILASVVAHNIPLAE
jgi:hypothetical protein